ncbi:hypothetical protein [Chamaesiphon minutus]|nr:hypothetical protein [Chamaesiphon minutus]
MINPLSNYQFVRVVSVVSILIVKKLPEGSLPGDLPKIPLL